MRAMAVWTSKVASWAVAIAVCGSLGSAQVLFTDDFNDGDAAGWTEFDGTFSVINGEYVIATSGFCNDGRTVNGDQSWTDYSIDVDFFVDSASSGAHAAVLFRIETVASGCDAGRYYQAYVYPNQVGFCLMNFSGGNCTILTTASVSTQLQAWHHMRLVVSGTEATMEIDGEHVLSYNGFTHYPAGQVGLKSINGYTVRYDNVVVSGESPLGPWADLRSGLPGSIGAPSLVGYGSLLAGAPTTLALSGALRSSAATLVVGLSRLDAPFKGGLMVPDTDLLFLGLTTDSAGDLNITGDWPTDVPAGSTFYFQYWVVDPGAPHFFAASNAVSGTTP